jgi:hypothetical protein
MIGEAALAIWFDVEATGLDEVNAWYPRQHLPERLSVPGFLRGRRYAAAGQGPGFFTLYETRDPSVLSSAAYRERLDDPTDWTRRSLAHFRRMQRSPYRLLARGGEDRVERHVLAVRIKPDSGRGPAVRQWLEREAVAALSALPGAGACAVYVADTSVPAAVTEERRIVGHHAEAGAPFVALCELGDASADADLLGFWDTWSRALAAEAVAGRYTLLHGLAWL